MYGKIKIFSKAIMLNRTFKLSFALIVSAVFLVAANNLFIAVKYVFDNLSANGLMNFSNGYVKTLILAASYTLCALLSVVIVSPLKFSVDIWFYESAKKVKTKIRNLFFSYKPHWFFKSVGLFFSLGFIKTLWSLLFFFPCAAIGGYLIYSLKTGISQTMLLLVVSCLAVSFAVGVFFDFVTFQRYCLCYILLYENDSLSPFEAIKYSARLMDENCFRLAFLKISFLPWFLCCLLIFPAFYVYPYYKISVSYFKNNILLHG